MSERIQPTEPFLRRALVGVSVGISTRGHWLLILREDLPVELLIFRVRSNGDWKISKMIKHPEPGSGTQNAEGILAVHDWALQSGLLRPLFRTRSEAVQTIRDALDRYPLFA